MCFTAHMNTNREHPLNIDLSRLVELVEQIPVPEKTPEEIDRAKTRALLNRARAVNRRRGK